MMVDHDHPKTFWFVGPSSYIFFVSVSGDQPGEGTPLVQAYCFQLFQDEVPGGKRTMRAVVAIWDLKDAANDTHSAGLYDGDRW